MYNDCQKPESLWLYLQLGINSWLGSLHLGSYLYGYDLGVIAEVIASKSLKGKFAASRTQRDLVVSMFTIGTFFGAGGAGPSGDYLGRRTTISSGCLIFCLGGCLKTGAQSLAYLYSGRFLSGFG